MQDNSEIVEQRTGQLICGYSLEQDRRCIATKRKVQEHPTMEKACKLLVMRGTRQSITRAPSHTPGSVIRRTASSVSTYMSTFYIDRSSVQYLLTCQHSILTEVVVRALSSVVYQRDTLELASNGHAHRASSTFTHHRFCSYSLLCAVTNEGIAGLLRKRCRYPLLHWDSDMVSNSDLSVNAGAKSSLDKGPCNG